MLFMNGGGKDGDGGRVFRATRQIAEAFEKNNLKFRAEAKDDDTSYVETAFGTKHGGSIQILFISHDDDNDVAVRSFAVISGVPAEKRAAVLEVINECNDEFRFAKFTIDEDGDINMEYDFPASAAEVGEPACEIAARFVQILDETYPRFMKVIWG
ncbi:MAG: YbjN domain-containing protein [Oscillospiraceae bacterium]|nr:YbjN domain-containing protein [Oscillospiraceae bacterium]